MHSGNVTQIAVVFLICGQAILDQQLLYCGLKGILPISDPKTLQNLLLDNLFFEGLQDRERAVMHQAAGIKQGLVRPLEKRPSHRHSTTG